MSSSIYRFPDVKTATGLSRCTIWRLEKAGTFPQRVTLSANTVGWRAEEVQSWVEKRQRVLATSLVTVGA